MKLLKAIGQLLGFVVWSSAVAWFFYGIGKINRPIVFQQQDEHPLMSVIELQRAVGAEPDGIVGPNTIAKWERAYANQEAAKFMTPTGKPKE